MHTKSYIEKEEIKDKKWENLKIMHNNKLYERFAYFPVLLDNGRWVWWEKYLKEINVNLYSKRKYIELYLESDIKERSWFDNYQIIRMK